MVAKISVGNSLYGALAYNGEKINKEEGRLLTTNRIYNDGTGTVEIRRAMEDFLALMPVRSKVEKPVVHISLNPHPDDMLTDTELQDIAREYLEKMGFGNQPYMVYKHEDIDRHHLHIVTVRVDGDGRSIDTRNNFYRSKQITRELERKYGLHDAERKSRRTDMPLHKVQHIAFSYPEWKLVDCDSLDNAADMVIQEKADCFLMGASQALIYDNSQNFKSVPLTKTMEACFTVRKGEGSLLSILNKTIKAMPSDMLTSALAIYDSTADKVTFSDFIKDNLLVFLATVGFLALSIIGIILVLLRKARKAEAVAKLAAKDTKKLNDKLEIALKKAEDASLAKTRFLNNMSHDIRTPMNAILGYAQLMEEELKEKDLPETSDHLEKLQQSGNLLLSIINNVLDMARIESGKMEIDENYGRIEDIRQTLFEIFGDEAKKKNIALHYTINVEHEHILTDTTKVKEIFVNILSNAIKYTPSGGSVMINVDELVCDEPGYMMVRTRVSDTGIGMSQDYLTKIFDASRVSETLQRAKSQEADWECQS